MQRTFLILMMFVFVPTLFLAGCGSSKSEVLAIVGGQEITTKEFHQALGNLPENYRVLAESYKGKRKILDNLIKKDLLIQEAEKRKLQDEKHVKEKMNEIKKKTKSKFKAEIRALQERLAAVDKQVYENVLLGELNIRLKKDGITGIEITKDQIEAYYKDYSRKLKILNPNAKVPVVKKVENKIKAILVEEELLQRLRKESKVDIKEEKFRKKYAEEDDRAIIDTSDRQ